MPKLINHEKKRLLDIPENAEKLKEAVNRYGLKMTREDVRDYLGGCSKPTAIKWLCGLPYTDQIRTKVYWTSDVVYRDLSTQGYEEAAG